MDNLLPHYEHELGLIARGLAEFAARYPKIAARLGLQGGHTDDPHIGRLTETFAFMNARLDAKIVDDYPESVEALLGFIYPHYLSGVPSCAVAQFDPSPVSGQITEPFLVPRGMPLDARAARCQFQTVYDVTLAPLRIDTARYVPTTLAPSAATLPADATGILSISFITDTPSNLFDAAIPSGPIRVYLSGDRPSVAALTDTFLLRATGAFVEVDRDGLWHALPKVPVEPVGFRDDERLLPDDGPNAVDSNAGPFRYLLEYFAFPEKFDFIDIDLGRIRRAARAPHARVLTLHVAVRDTPKVSVAAQMLDGVDASAFRLFCTPVINLFKRAALPVHLTATDTAWPITPEPLGKSGNGPALDIYSIDAVYLGERTKTDKNEIPVVASSSAPRTRVQAWQSLGRASASRKEEVYWRVFRDPDSVFWPDDTPWRLSLVGFDGASVPPGRPQADIDLFVTNGDRPAQLPTGGPDGDLYNEAMALSCPILLLTRPTLRSELPRGQGALWRVLSTLTPHPMDLTPAGLGAVKEFLRLHAPRSTTVARRSIDALTGLDYRPAIRWMFLDSPFPSFVRGLEIFVSIDEAALREVTLSAFAGVLDRFFAPYAMTNSYVQLVIRSAASGAELLRCEARPGTRVLV